MKNRLKKLLVPAVKPIISKIHPYKDVHRGESCYLIGDGASVKWFDLSSFRDKTAIPCAFIPFHKDFEKLNTQYLSVQEPWWFYPWERTTDGQRKIIGNPRQKAYREVIDKYPDKMFFINLSNYPVLRRKNIVYTFKNFNDARLLDTFVTNRINSFHGSLRFSITLAIYLGFEKCFLVGYDYTHLPCRNGHWYEKGEGGVQSIQNYNEDFFSIAKDFIDITTITLSGTSEYLNSVTYQEYTGKIPVYKENTELMERRYLKILATWPGYNIL